MKVLKTLSVFLAAVATVLFVVTILLQDCSAKGPVISMNSETIEISVSDKDGILSGVTAEDPEDGDVSFSLIVESISPFVAPGERVATIAAFDSDNHVTESTRTIRYIDYTSPVFSMSGPLSFAVGSNIEGITQKFTAVDCIEGDITHRITRVNAEDSEFNSDIPGIYKMLFSVSNEAGDVEQLIASVEIYDKTEIGLPSIRLTDAMIYLPQNSEFDPMQYLSSIALDRQVYDIDNGSLVDAQTGNIIGKAANWEQLEIVNPVDTQKPGWYEVEYTVTSEKAQTRTAYLLVRVEDR